MVKSTFDSPCPVLLCRWRLWRFSTTTAGLFATRWIYLLDTCRSPVHFMSIKVYDVQFEVPCHLPYSRKLSREKTFMKFVVLWLLAKFFSSKFGGMASVGTAKVSNPRKLFPSRIWTYDFWNLVWCSYTTSIGIGADDSWYISSLGHRPNTNPSQYWVLLSWYLWIYFEHHVSVYCACMRIDGIYSQA